LIGRVVNFLEHQKISKPKPSKLKKYWEDGKPLDIYRNTPGGVPEHSGRSPGTLREESPQEGIRDQGSGKGEYTLSLNQVENQNISDKDKLKSQDRELVLQGIEVESDSSLKIIQETVLTLGPKLWDMMRGPVFIREIRKNYLEGLDVEAVSSEVRKEVQVRDDFTPNNWGDVSRIMNGLFRRFAEVERRKNKLKKNTVDDGYEHPPKYIPGQFNPDFDRPPDDGSVTEEDVQKAYREAMCILGKEGLLEVENK
jgi:hypothetical protein